MAAYDLVIIGGGIGGSALATVMAKAGASVLVLEASTEFPDRVRGEWIAPWGVAETRRVGLYDTLMAAGGHHIARHATYDETLDPASVEAMPLTMFLPDVPGPLCIGHPHHCQTLFDAAGRVGATMLRGVQVTGVTFAPTPSATYVQDGQTLTATARLIVGADGRTSMVREAAGITLHQDKPHHMFAGLLVDGVPDWEEDLQSIGTEGDFAYLTFPQGGGRARIYGSYALDERRRFAGPDGPKAFLEAFRMASAPKNETIAVGTPAGPLLTYFNNDSWTDRPYAEGMVLVGDAAGWNDPIIGQGLSITYRDVRVVSDILKGPDWSADAFAPYGEERFERMRRLRFCAELTSVLEAEFGPEAKARRARYHERSKADPSIGARAFAVMAGPEMLPPEMFTPEHRAHVLGESG
jgi:2-polyprenyl-6-methoxyphenol hydroxylase-like FAD-dependent oxidoreductase